MKTNKKAYRGGVLLLTLILAVNILIPASAWAAVPGPSVVANITIDGVAMSVYYSDLDTVKWHEDKGFTVDSDGYVVYNGCHLTLDGSNLVLGTEHPKSGGDYTTVPIPLDFTAPESLSMRVTQGHSDLAIDPCVITNTGSEDLKLSQVEITAASGWTVVNASTDFTTADSKNKIAFTARDHDFANGAYALGETIAARSNTTLQLAGKISEKADLTNATQVASMVVTVERNVTLISFTIDGTSYQAESGMTWGEWFKSEYSSSLPQTMTCKDCGAVEYFGEFSSLFYGQTIGWKASLGCDTCILMEGASKAVGINEVIYSENYLFYKNCND